jgi:hypothetical protein
MALTVALKIATVFGNKRYITADVTFDSSYATGGLSLKAVDLGLSAIDLVMAAQTGGYLLEYDHTNAKLKAYAPDGANHTHTIALAASSVVAGADNTIVKKDGTHIEVSGNGTGVTLTTSASGAGAAEVTAATNLSTLTARIFVVGS